MPRDIKSITDIRAEARKYTKMALNTLVGVASSEKAQPAARVAAAQSLLDRGWGKATQPISGEEGGPLTVILRQFTDAGNNTPGQ